MRVLIVALYLVAAGGYGTLGALLAVRRRPLWHPLPRAVPVAVALLAASYLVYVALAPLWAPSLVPHAGGVLASTLLGGFVLGALALAFSKSLRARARVALSKQWLPYKYDYRVEWLDLTARLTRDSAHTSLAQRTAEAFRNLGRAPGAAVLIGRDGSLRPAYGSGFTVAAGVAEPLDGAFCRFLEAREWIVDLAAARVGRDAEVPLPAWLTEAQDAWLAIPLLHDRKLEALVVLREPSTPQPLAWEDLDLLRTAGVQAASYFALERAAEELAREQQFAAVNRFTAFMVHDLANTVAQLRLIVENAARHKQNPEFIDDVIRTIENSVERMTRLLAQLKGGPKSAAPRRVDLATPCRQATERASNRLPRPTLRAADVPVPVFVDAERFEQVLEHLIRNAQDATPADGSVNVSLGAEDGWAIVEVSDTGAGMTADFVNHRLFVPFDTTKGERGMGMGAYQARELVRNAGGSVQVSSAPGAGTRFVIRLPRVI